MKKFSDFVKEGLTKGKSIDLKDSINYIDEKGLKKYLEITDKIISQEAKDIVNWLIVNNKTYIADLSTDDDENALAGFFNAGKPKEDGPMRELWLKINAVLKSRRMLEIPVFQTKKEFDSIISMKVPADYVILRLDTERGRNAIPKIYARLIETLVTQWVGKSTLDRDELRSAAYDGVTLAMNNYGKKNKTIADEKNVKGMNFGQFLAFAVRFSILDAIKNESHTVRIPISAQRKEKKATGSNTKNNTISGDKAVGNSEDGSKTLFDFLGYVDSSANDVDNDDMNNLWDEAMKMLKKEFKEETLDIFFSYFGLQGKKQMSNKDLAKKYDCGPSKISYYVQRVIHYIRTNKKMLEIFGDINELMAESLAKQEDAGWSSEEPYHIPDFNKFDQTNEYDF